MNISITKPTISVTEHRIEETSFSEQDIKKCRKKLKKAGIPKEYWFIEILDRTTGEIRKYLL